MYKSIILPLAKEDIREATLWYNRQSKGLGKRFMDDVWEKIHYIKQNPKTCNVRYDDVRTAILNMFPFMVHYTIDQSSKTVIIAAVLHTSRDPKVWQKR